MRFLSVRHPVAFYSKGRAISMWHPDNATGSMLTILLRVISPFGKYTLSLTKVSNGMNMMAQQVSQREALGYVAFRTSLADIRPS